MSVGLTDVLIDLANPRNLLAYQKNPTQFLEAYSLDLADRQALAQRAISPLRLRAQSIDPGDRRNAFTQFPRAGSDVELVVDELHVEVSVTANDMVALGVHGLKFKDEFGRMYTGAPKERD